MKFQLSSETSVEIQRKTSGRRPAYLAFECKRGEGSSTSSVFMSSPMVQALYKKSARVALLWDKQRVGRVLLRCKQYALVTPQNVGLHQLDMHGKIITGTGITLNKDEWEMLLPKLPTLAMGVTATNITRQYKCSGQWHFGYHEGVANVDDIRVIDTPKIEDVMSCMYFYLLHQGVLLEIRTRCIGCKLRKPLGLQVHTCGQSWNEAIENYAGDVGGRLNRGKDAMERMFRCVLEELDLLPPFSIPGMFLKMLLSHDASYLTQRLRMSPADDITPPEYAELFDKIRYNHC